MISVERALVSESSLDIMEELPTPKEIILEGELRESMIREISRIKHEPRWMLKLRLRAFEFWKKLPMPKWLRGIDELDIGTLAHYVKPAVEKSRDYDTLPTYILEIYKKLGIPEDEAKYLAGLTGVLDSENILVKIKEWLKNKGVIFVDTDEAIKRYPELVKRYFGRIYPMSDHKFSALHYALWSGGAFVYVPKNVRIDQALEAFFMISGALESQYEHTMVVADEGSYIEFVEGCAAPMFPKYSFHDGAVEIYVHKGAHVRFITMQNWSKKIINFNNKRAMVEENGVVEWIEGSIGAKVSYVYPSAILKGRGSRTMILAISLAKGPYIKDSGGKVYHLAPDTSSQIISKSISADGGLTTYRGLVYIKKGAKRATATVSCDSLILDERSIAETIPHNQVFEPTAEVTHEATAGRISEDVLFYLESRGLTENEAKSLLVLGFIQDLVKELPFDMAAVLRNVILMEFSELGGVG